MAVFVSDEVARSVLTWPEKIARLKGVYSVEHPPFAGPPRTLARGKGIWMRTLTGVLPDGRVMGTKQFCFPRARKVLYMITLFDTQATSPRRLQWRQWPSPCRFTSSGTGAAKSGDP